MVKLLTFIHRRRQIETLKAQDRQENLALETAAKFLNGIPFRETFTGIRLNF